MPGGAADPVCQGRAIQIQALSGVDLRSAIHRQVVGIFAHQHPRDRRLGSAARLQSFAPAPEPARPRPRRRGRHIWAGARRSRAAEPARCRAAFPLFRQPPYPPAPTPALRPPPDQIALLVPTPPPPADPRPDARRKFAAGTMLSPNTALTSRRHITFPLRFALSPPATIWAAAETREHLETARGLRSLDLSVSSEIVMCRNPQRLRSSWLTAARERCRRNSALTFNLQIATIKATLWTAPFPGKAPDIPERICSSG